MTIKEAGLCRYFYIFPLQTTISEPTDFVQYFQNPCVRGLFLRWSTLLCGKVWCCVVMSGDCILPTCFEIELSGMQQVKIFLNWVILPVFIGEGIKIFVLCLAEVQGMRVATFGHLFTLSLCEDWNRTSFWKVMFFGDSKYRPISFVTDHRPITNKRLMFSQWC